MMQPNITLQHGEEIINTRISQELYDRIKREITRAQVICTTDEPYVVNDLIKQLLANKCWNNISEFNTKVLAPVLDAFNRVDIDPQKFFAYVKSISKTSNKIRQHLLGSQNTTHDLYDLMPLEFVSMFDDASQARVLFDAIYNITPPGIGRGEIILTLVSDSIKSNRGDLCFADLGAIDVKGDGGRLGGDGFAADRSPIMVDGILQSVGINTRQQLIDATCKRMEKLLCKHAHLSDLHDIVVHRAFTHRMFADMNYKFEEMHGASARVAQDLRKHTQRVVRLITNQKLTSFNDVATTFFQHANTLTHDQFIDGVLMMRSYHMREHTQTLHDALHQMIAPGEQQEFTAPSKYLSLIAALHLVCYVVVEGRQGVVFLNDRSKTAISFRTQNNIYNDLIAAHNMFTHHDFKLCAAIDHRGKTISVKFNE